MPVRPRRARRGDVDADDLAGAGLGEQAAAVAGAAAGVEHRAAGRGLGGPQVPGEVLGLDQPSAILVGYEALRDPVL